MSQKKKHSYFSPLLIATAIVIGIMVGTFYANHFSGNRLSIINANSNKLNNLLHIIGDQYVDTVNMHKLVEDAMPVILSELDPHSVYIPAKDAQLADDELRGSFSGVGIQFVIREDTIHIQDVVPGGPSEHVGIIAGDKIVSVDGRPFVGDSITSEKAIRTLKGPKDTKITIGILRYKETEERLFTVTRGDVHQKSITATYMLDGNTGYIRVRNFGEQTYAELLVSLARLSQQEVRNLVIDLRGNTGGYLAAAAQMVNEFLPKNRLIVYTEGRNSPRQNFYSDGRGSYQHIPLVVLIDEGSASAAEIFAGAVQDNDRGTVIGRRSFGKGLVQQPMAFNDGSVVRLTVARYYTPSGRCIQKPYNAGDGTSYQQDLITRYEHGEFFSQDSIKHTGPEYHTANGRTVYGGGGITPDIFVGEDTLGVTSYYKEAIVSGLVLTYAFNYTDENRERLNKFETMEDLAKYLDRQGLVEKFVQYAEKKKLKRRNLMIKKSYTLLKRFIISRIIYNIQHEEDWIKYLNLEDPVISAAIKVFNEGKAFPEKPAMQEEGKAANKES